MSSKHASMSDSEIEQHVIAVISSKTKMSPDKILPDTSFSELGIDSLDAVTIMFALEEKFEVEISGHDPLKVKNVRETAQLLSQALARLR